MHFLSSPKGRVFSPIIRVVNFRIMVPSPIVCWSPRGWLVSNAGDLCNASVGIFLKSVTAMLAETRLGIGRLARGAQQLALHCDLAGCHFAWSGCRHHGHRGHCGHCRHRRRRSRRVRLRHRCGCCWSCTFFQARRFPCWRWRWISPNGIYRSSHLYLRLGHRGLTRFDSESWPLCVLRLFSSLSSLASYPCHS